MADKEPGLRRRRAEAPSEGGVHPPDHPGQPPAAENGGAGVGDQADPEDGLRKFPLREYLAHPENQPILRKFVLTAVKLATLPIVNFFVAQFVTRTVAGARDERSIGALIVALGTMFYLMGRYAYDAYLEEVSDWNKRAAGGLGAPEAPQDKKNKKAQ